MKQNLTLLAFASLTVIFSCTDEGPTDIQEDPSEACFDITPVEGNVGDEIQFTNCSQNATHFAWTFGDGGSSTQREPVYIYQRRGNYEIRLLAGEDKNQDGVLNAHDDPDSTFQSIEISPNHLAAELTIYSAGSWTPENPEFSIVSGATIFLYKEYSTSFDLGEPEYTFTSDENGKIVFYDEEVAAECFIVKKGEESNIVNGYLIEGVFQNQEEINNSAQQEGATVGGLKYVDLNADGVITESDQTPCGLISISPDETFKRDIIIAE